MKLSPREGMVNARREWARQEQGRSILEGLVLEGEENIYAAE